MKPLLTSLTAHHQGVLIRDPIPTNTILFRIINYELQMPIIQQLLNPFQRLTLVLVMLFLQLLFLGTNRSVLTVER